MDCSSLAESFDRILYALTAGVQLCGCGFLVYFLSDKLYRRIPGVG